MDPNEDRGGIGGGDWSEARLTAAIVIVTLVTSALVLLSGRLDAFAYGVGFVPLRLGDAVLPGGLPLVVPAWLTPLSATFVHGGVAHVAFNLVMMVYCGRMLERAVGAAGLAVIYVVGAYAAAAVQFGLDPQSAAPMIGASGAISAVLGAYALLYGTQRSRAIGPISADVVHVLWLAAAWIGVQLLIGAAGMGGVSVAIGAHIGGFAAGLVLARPMLLWRYRHA